MRYATIELNSGYVWWVGEAADPIDACRKSDAESKEDKSGTYRRISRSELSRAALDEMIGEESRPWATTRKDVEDLIVHNWEWHWKDVENRIQRLFRQAL